MNPAPLFRVFRAFRELLGAVLSLGVLIWGFSNAMVALFLAATGRLPEIGDLARDHFMLCMVVGAVAEIGGRLVTWPLAYEIRMLGAKQDR